MADFNLSGGHQSEWHVLDEDASGLGDHTEIGLALAAKDSLCAGGLFDQCAIGVVEHPFPFLSPVYHAAGPKTKRARSWRSISNGVITFTPSPTQTFGDFYLVGRIRGFLVGDHYQTVC